MMKSLTVSLVIAAPLLIWATVSLAASSTEEEDLAQVYGGEEMGSATGTRQPVGKAPAVASVVTAADIKAMGATDIDEVLETARGTQLSWIQPDLYVSRCLFRLQPAGADVDQRRPHHLLHG
ncbi:MULTISPECIES: hypothetical protein [Methylomonas]|uniref:hypothetical protein n=1 Tax=Methylomonas TaxID=416 RepID=UPI001E2DB8DF|nr:hypothetical protein [Methylomonas koyamae]